MPKLEDKQRVFAFVVLYGFETKNYFGSGLFEEISKSFKTIVLRRDFSTENFNEYISDYQLNVEVIPQVILQRERQQFENLLLASRRANKRLNNIGNFNYFKTDRTLKWTDYILGNVRIGKILTWMAKKQVASNYFSKDLEEIYDKYGVTDVVIAGYSSVESIVLAQTAKKANCNVWLTINSWKDFYVNDLVSFEPTKVFVWSQNMGKQLIASNSHMNERNVSISGNPSFDRFYKYIPTHTKGYYAKKYSFDSNCPMILYSMISPKAYDVEKESIELINQKLIKQYTEEDKRPIIILRRNPIDETVVDEKYFSDDNVRYADNYFEGSYENAIFVQLNEGETEWMDLLYYANININVASTVTLEALMLSTLVINIEFDGTGQKNEQLSRYADAPFYAPLHGRMDVSIVPTIDECMEAIDTYLYGEISVESLYPIVAQSDGKSSQRITEEIANG